MLHHAILASLTALTLMTCENKTTNQDTTETATETKQTSVNPGNQPASTNMPQNPKEPEMAPGLPPDREAVIQAEKEAAAAAANQQGTVFLKEGENVFLKEQQMNVTFLRISEDSRCPKDVNCIWEGVASAEVELMGTTTRPRVLKLSTMNDANKNYSKTQHFNGYEVTLVSVSPETTAEKGFSELKGKYKIGLKFSRGSENPATTK